MLAVQGIGGLGHLAAQLARHIDFRIVAIGRGREKEKLAKDFGAHFWIDAAAEDARAVPRRTSGARGNLAAGTSDAAMGPLVSALTARGSFISVSVPQDQIQLNAFPLVSGRRSVYGRLTGAPTDGEDALAFRVLENIRPMSETFLLEKAARAYACMTQDEAPFRLVLVTKNGGS
ncbi:MAG TPA: zinc-binding dehydrogenase [Candidatus Acidoferrum sp.]|jgi:D-arabinose 1-dehydrogenase-like Zn-dependent alcohol dehydrogenase|nr:zinc-binding dehydrogenase [Candidatus Acidoferrum sp.]